MYTNFLIIKPLIILEKKPTTHDCNTLIFFSSPLFCPWGRSLYIIITFLTLYLPFCFSNGRNSFVCLQNSVAVRQAGGNMKPSDGSGLWRTPAISIPNLLVTCCCPQTNKLNIQLVGKKGPCCLLIWKGNCDAVHINSPHMPCSIWTSLRETPASFRYCPKRQLGSKMSLTQVPAHLHYIEKMWN